MHLLVCAWFSPPCQHLLGLWLCAILSNPLLHMFLRSLEKPQKLFAKISSILLWSPSHCTKPCVAKGGMLALAVTMSLTWSHVGMAMG